MRVFISYLSKMKIVSRFLFFVLALFTAGFNHFLLWTYLNSSMTRSLTNILPPLSNLNDLNSHVSWCLGVGGQIDGKNPNKLTPPPPPPQMGREFGVWCWSYLVLFIFAYVLREMGSNREMEPKWFQWRLWLTFFIELLLHHYSNFWYLLACITDTEAY